jgi:hypothetical protein
MSDIRVKRTFFVTSGTFTGNSSVTTALDVGFRLCHVTVSYDASITNNCTVTLDANDGATYDTVLTTADNSAGATANYITFADGAVFENGDQIVVAVNVGADNAYVRIVTEAV